MGGLLLRLVAAGGRLARGLAAGGGWGGSGALVAGETATVLTPKSCHEKGATFQLLTIPARIYNTADLSRQREVFRPCTVHRLVSGSTYYSVVSLAR